MYNQFIFYMNTIRFYLCSFFFVISSLSYSQITIKEVQDIFSQAAPFSWAIPIPNTNSIPLQWQEKTTSMTTKGIRSFVGYYENNFVATLSINENDISGTYYYGDDSFEISSKGNKLVFSKNNYSECGTKDTHSHIVDMPKARSGRMKREINSPKIENTDVLKVYRLALNITYTAYEHLGKDLNKVNTYITDTELFLNEIYTRDLGIRFEAIRDNRLINTNPDVDSLSSKDPNYIINNNTNHLNKAIGENAYDIGICIAYPKNNTRYKGLAYLNYAYTKMKADAFAILTKETIAHEIGHLFGAIHTFSGPINDPSSDKTEYFRGQSVMSYGSPRNFFSLASIERIRKTLYSVPYYSDKERTKVVGNPYFANIPYGIPINTLPPIIDKAQIKPEYIIPENTFFQFYIPATDPDSNKLLYTANQHDVSLGKKTSITQYTIYKPTPNNPVTFKKEYNETFGTYDYNSWLTDQRTGTFTFWLSANDANPNQPNNYITQYDLVETKVTIKAGKPFTLEPLSKKAYKGGEKVMLTWQVDNTIFSKDSKVRILLSDDFGKTFNHILLSSTENDGSQEVTMPNINIGKKQFGTSSFTVPAGVIKVEVIDGLAFALTDYAPRKEGGFTIEMNNNLSEPLAFVTTPEDITFHCPETTPKVDYPTLKGGKNPKITYNDELINGNCPNNYTIKRTFTVRDDENNTLTHTQRLYKVDKQPPVFNNLPPKTINSTVRSIPPQGEISASDSCAGHIDIKKYREEVLDQEGKLSKVIYKWVATDACGNENSFTQTINIKPEDSLVFLTTPQDITIECDTYKQNVTYPTFKGTCKPTISYNDERIDGNCPNNYTIKRTFTVKDECNNTIIHSQIIRVQDTQKPIFIGELPKDIHTTINNIPKQKDISTTDNCTNNVKIEKVKEEEYNSEGKLSKVIYKWVATDACGNENTHTQYIHITQEKPSAPAPNPSNEHKDNTPIIYNAISLTNSSLNYFKVDNINTSSPISLDIFNELGQLVYHSDDYQKNGNIFKGVSNVKGVVSKDSYLESGTYFYILKYQTESGESIKKGFLYIK